MSTHANPRQPMPIHVPIAGQFFTKKGKFVNCPIWANPSKSNANPCQSNANFRPFTWAIPALKLGTSPLYGMAPSLIGGWIKANSPVIDWQVIGTGPNPFQSMPILTNPVPIPGQSMSTHATPCANRRSIFHKRKVCQLSNLSQSQQIQCQSWPIQCQFHAITEAICPFNLGTSPLYGMVPSLLGGRNVRNSTRSASPYGQSRTSP